MSRTAPFTFYEFFAGGGMARLGLGEHWRCLFANDFDPIKASTYRANFGDDDFVEGDVYGNVVSGFSHWYVTLFYLLAMLALGFHLYHGVWSMFQTLGVNRRKYNRFFRGLALVSAVLIAVGGCVVPVAVLTGIIS